MTVRLRLGGLRDGFFIQGQCCIFMFDLTSRLTYNNIPHWYSDWSRLCEGPCVLCGNKADAVNARKVLPKAIRFGLRHNLPYFDVSACTNFNFMPVFEVLTRQLLQDDTITLIASSGLHKPSFVMPETYGPQPVGPDHNGDGYEDL
eukprot:TRINITY_DN2602_c0_g1_i2.p2 TRINITY_DN2602_c0_g1~~TRINITY_DN2602_c0_g1_i2.p2  ORF type:complete len:146 (+),score=3.84 TRINITY_DN2602_c0_g1_i2:375-812(+)